MSLQYCLLIYIHGQIRSAAYVPPYLVSGPILLAGSYIYVSEFCNMSPVTASWLTTVNPTIAMWLLGLWSNNVGESEESEERQPVDNIFYNQIEPNNVRNLLFFFWKLLLRLENIVWCTALHCTTLHCTAINSALVHPLTGWTSALMLQS